ncbi:Carboxysome shell and ethanolamine utilization microcompartment protein CcmL/EutN [Pilibacter termitis]|uniref:Carboxysome shell and ethanolamine utilization microcompartment protein CcmL/EutN n=1 Tax=Pilibacter termitis TaxID=263852 RepID=A0A1T4L979_9ENTE|nr:BMC domain-containing protein [Pilibacter termitis]SJZ51246.1 Carboxysome shell and ethanolamine utilization microcompartment protein CcmL/EutN [Pilibacter termitis]
MKIDTLGFLELNSISKGIETVDQMLKIAEIELIYAKASCPGKYYILVAGDTSSVERSIQYGVEIGESHIVGNLVIPRISEEVIKGINRTDIPESVNAVGVMEYYSCSGSILAADVAVKSANVSIVALRLATGIAGKSYVVVTGDTEACNTAIEAGVHSTKDVALLINKVVISNPRKEVFESLVY